MYRCPNCSAGMRYDIKSQKMLCDYCGHSCAISEHPKQQEDAKKEEYEVTVFTCPQCGGEIRSTDNAAAEFCSYCGASVMLEGRLVNEKKPALIVPFSRTKDDCKDSFKKRANRAWCLPREYKDPDKLEKFTGIYMPYWIYEVNQDASPRLEATRSSGNYTEYMNLDLSVQHTYDWITFDAASDFDDDLSNVINNFEANDSTAFSTAYLSGFYADSPDFRGWIPALKLDPVDTTGAGDCFAAVFLAATIKGYPVREACQRACRAASLSTLSTGASGAILAPDTI